MFVLETETSLPVKQTAYYARRIVVDSPIDTYSGYGSRARDFARELLKAANKEDIIYFISRPWGNTQTGVLHPTKDWEIFSRLTDERVLRDKENPVDIYIQISVANEFVRRGKVNIGVTAGIEAHVMPLNWIQTNERNEPGGMNVMDCVIFSSQNLSNHLMNTVVGIKRTLSDGKVDMMEVKPTVQTGALIEACELSKPLEQIREDSTHLDLYTDLNNLLKSEVNFLYVGSWLGHTGAKSAISSSKDRKDLSGTIKCFMKAFKHVSNKPDAELSQIVLPSLVIKANITNQSIVDYSKIKRVVTTLVDNIKTAASVPNNKKIVWPEVHVLHGDLSEEEMGCLYTHPKISAMISTTHGEGWGRPLLEAMLHGLPVIAPKGFGGHLDFYGANQYMHKTLGLDGVMEGIPPVAREINPFYADGAQWFVASEKDVVTKLKYVAENVQTIKALCQPTVEFKKTFSFKSMRTHIHSIVNSLNPSMAVFNDSFTTIKSKAIGVCMLVGNEPFKMVKERLDTMVGAQSKNYINDILLVFDTTSNNNSHASIKEYITSSLPTGAVMCVDNALNGDFAAQRNKGNELLQDANAYILHLDPDEHYQDDFFEKLALTVQVNPDVDVFAFCRENTLDDMTPAEIVNDLGFNVDAQGRVNWPDYQVRLQKSASSTAQVLHMHPIWNGKVHERLIGYFTFTIIPDTVALIKHHKTKERQLSQNALYNELAKL